MPETLWVSMPIIRNIVMGTAKNSNELETLCRMGDIAISDLDNSELRVSLDKNCKIMDAAINMSGDPNLGLHIGEKITPVVLGITGHLVQSSRDMLSALQNLQDFTSSFTRLYHFQIVVTKDEAFFYCEPLQVWNDISPDTARHSVDIAFAGALRFINLLTGQNLIPKKVLYRYTRLKDLSEHERIFKCRPLFNQDGNCLVFHLADLQFPVIGYNQELNLVFKKLLNEELQKYQTGESFTEKLRQVILKNYQSAFPQLEELSFYMNITPRTLQRKLQDENSSFRLLSDSIKQELALNLLLNESLSIAGIAYKLGYSEPGSFRKAFKAWTGKNPLEYKKDNFSTGTGNAR